MSELILNRLESPPESEASQRQVNSKPLRVHVSGLDTLRFICAMIVVADHIGLYTISPALKTAGWPRILGGILGCLINGPAAVIVFFIISGFCIHFPYRDDRRLVLSEYYARRFVRIGIPCLAFVLYFRLVIKDASSLQNTVLWSVFCEMIYYLMYPALRILRRKMDWVGMTAISLAISLAVSMTHLEQLRQGNNDVGALGFRFTWLIGLPVWIMGCWLAENYFRFPLLSTSRMWQLRSIVYIVSVLIRMAKFHVTSVIASNCFTLTAFAFLAVFWVGCEIVFITQHKPVKRLEWFGTWSYSIYLVHTLAAATIAMLGFRELMQRGTFDHIVVILLTLVISYVFYLVCERPSHKLAVKVGRLFAQRYAS